MTTAYRPSFLVDIPFRQEVRTCTRRDFHHETILILKREGRKRRLAYTYLPGKGKWRHWRICHARHFKLFLPFFKYFEYTHLAVYIYVCIMPILTSICYVLAYAFIHQCCRQSNSVICTYPVQTINMRYLHSRMVYVIPYIRSWHYTFIFQLRGKCND